METMRGKVSREISASQFRERFAGYRQAALDLGTGDGRYVHVLAQRHPDQFVIGIDACRENLREHSRSDLPNMLFVIAEAQHLPAELAGLALSIHISFPWGSLLQGLLRADAQMMNGLVSIAAGESASLEIRLNAGALAEAGSTLEEGAAQIRDQLWQWGWQANAPRRIERPALLAFPSTWARRLAFGRDPRALLISARLAAQITAAR